MALDQHPQPGSTDSSDYAEKYARVSFQIHQVADLLDVPAGTIRNWQDRYGFLAEASGRGSYRRVYSLAEVLKIDSVRRLVKEGGKPRNLCKMTAAELKDQILKLDSGSLRPVKEALFAALREKDLIKFDTLLKSLSFNPLVCEMVIEPLLIEIGELWHRNEFTIADEHLFSGALRMWIMVAPAEARVFKKRLEVVIGAVGADQHEGAILLMSSIFRKEGIRVNYLGPNIPSLEIARTDQGKTRRMYILSSAIPGVNFRKEVMALAEMKSIVIVGGHSVEKTFPGDGFHGVLTLSHFSASRFAALMAKAVRLGFIQP